MACTAPSESITIQSLRQILKTGNAIKSLCPQPPTPVVLLSDSSPASFKLQTPPSIYDKLLELDLDPIVAQKLSLRYTDRCNQLQFAAQNILNRTCLELASVPRHSGLIPLSRFLEGVVAAHTASYSRAIRDLEQRALSIATRLNPVAHQRKVKPSAERPSFNHEFTPFLQKYFEYNAFPSAADRVEMAKKSMMEPRQIEVWFQNHRRRAKQEGKSVKKLGPADPAPLELCLKSMEEKMEPYLIPDGLRQSVDSEVSEAGSEDEEEDDDDFYDEKTEVVDLTDVLNPPAARHAFPVLFKESRHFSSTILPTQEFSFPAPVWRRKAAVKALERPTVTIEELMGAFALLNVHDMRPVLSPPFQIATTVIPSAAPIPALVRSRFPPSAVLATRSLNTVAAPRSRRHPFRSPSPYAQPATLVPAHPRRKKVAGPPRRTPKRAANHRGSSPATSDTSTLRSVSPPSRISSFASSISRTPSLESNGFSPSRTPSFGSSGFSSRSSSSSSSGPTTPSGSPSALPLEIADSAFHDFFGEQYSSPVDTPADMHLPTSGKQQRQFGFARYATR
ncbi:hypothetical protein B0H13DRAFT_1108340 [Mycena leptocephala]|nr:hypothetical protein B0H13DRAFT_1108340 [Mycena leptocephala]